MTITTLDIPCIVVGSGIAGLSAALGHGDCVVISKTGTGEGSSRWAQGGIAAAVGTDDEPRLHAIDTETVGGGLTHNTIASIVTDAAPDRIRWLTELGAEFDRDRAFQLTLGREAGHSRRRIVHANGDATGAEVMRVLTHAVAARPDIECLTDTRVIDLLLEGQHVVGVLAAKGNGELIAITARSVILATGGLGQIYRHTTNPQEVAADGMAMAIRAGVTVRDPEFVQFHPTALDSTLDPMPLLTEALRGEGAHLLDEDGRRFMVDVHDDAELAPRDVVARQIWFQRRRGQAFLDARCIGEDFANRFPTVWKIAQHVGLDPRTDLLPVSPAQHYHMGGVAADEYGRTSAPGLYAIGETSCTGLHGANRLASNSLLEGLVFGARAAETARGDRHAPARNPTVVASAEQVDLSLSGSSDAIMDLRQTMWDHVGLVRDAEGLEIARGRIADLSVQLASHPVGRNLATAARVVTDAAAARTESRGSHHRLDHSATQERGAHTEITPRREATTALGSVRSRHGVSA